MVDRHVRTSLWLLWGVLSLIGAGYLTVGVLKPKDRDGPFANARGWLVPGATTHGHYQIELACESCHRGAFATADDVQEACVGCHGRELKEADDKHPLTKFIDPRNASLLERIDATMCVTCHTEHRPRVTNAMAVTLPADLCMHCHESIAEDRPSHAGMAFDTCASSGCHNFHDNRALYEDFLLRHLDSPAVAAKPSVAARDFAEIAAMLPDYPSDRYPLRALDATAIDAPASAQRKATVVDEWLKSAHARAGVNCSGCHVPAEPEAAAWIDEPDHRACQSCHAQEVDGFMSGKHGMRLAQGFSPMRPADARLPMRDAAAHLELRCTSCHTDHSFETRRAAVDACLGCHADTHSVAYRTSKHFALWEREIAADGKPGSGVSCATCHLPRIEHRDVEFDLRRTLVQHNQNDALRPNEKMVRPVCLSCHGLQFALDALADPLLIESNFTGSPKTHVSSLEMARRRLEEFEAQRRNE